MKKMRLVFAMVLALALAMPMVAMANMKVYFPGVKVVTKTIKDSNRDMKFPQVEMKGKQAIQDRINGYITQEVNLFLADHKAELAAKQAKVSCVYDVKYNANTVLSVTLLEEGYVDHAAHGFKTMRGLNFSTEDGHLITPQELSNSYVNVGMINDNPFALANIDAAVKAAAKAGKFTLLNDYKGITALPTDFYLDKDMNPVAIFQPATVAPYVNGILEVALTK